MGLILSRHLTDKRSIALWELPESEKKRKDLYGERAALLAQQLLQQKETPQISHDDYGRPFIRGSSWDISISHSYRLVAVQIARGAEAGIDIQRIRPDISHIALRFMGGREMKCCHAAAKIQQNDFMHIVWGAKEVLYKIYGKRGVIFKKELFISPFRVSPAGEIKGTIEKGKFRQTFPLYYEKTGRYMLVYAL